MQRTLQFDNLTHEQLQHIINAEVELLKAGVSFDTGGMAGSSNKLTRDWELDWSLTGAKLIIEEDK